VSSLAAQPPRAVDRPALGAFINVALDLANHPDWVEAHNRFYTRAQRQGTTGTVTAGKPEGSFASATFVDGAPPAGAGAIVPPTRATIDDGFSMDATGLALWTLCEHAKWLNQRADGVINDAQKTYLTSVYPAIKRTATLLLDCVDGKSALPCAAFEGDGTERVQTLRGSAAVFLGLYSASRTAAVLGHSGDARIWQSRMFNLLVQMDKAPPNGFLKLSGGYSGDLTARALTIWPAQIHIITDTRTQATAEALEGDLVPLFDGHTTSESPARVMVPLGIFEFDGSHQDVPAKTKLLAQLDTLARQMRNPLGHFGEVVAAVDPVGYDPRVGVPSASEAAMVYLATLSVRTRPAGETSPLVRTDVRASQEADSGFQCQFRVVGGRYARHGVAAALAVLALGVVLVVRRRRR
jgi:hypothetical protein